MTHRSLFVPALLFLAACGPSNDVDPASDGNAFVLPQRIEIENCPEALGTEDCEQWLREQAEVSTGDTALLYRLKALSNLMVDDEDQAASELTELEGKIQEAKFYQGKAVALETRANISELRGDYSAAKVEYKEALDVYETLEFKEDMARCCFMLGMTAQNFGNLEEAEESFTQALALAEEIDDQPKVAASVSNLGYIKSQKGDYEGAISYVTRAMEIAKEQDDDVKLGYLYLQRAYFHAETADFESALSDIEQAKEFALESNSKSVLLLTLVRSGEVYHEIGEVDSVISYFDQAQVLAEELGEVERTAYTRTRAGSAYFERGDYDQAKALFEHALREARPYQLHNYVAHCYEMLAQIAEKQGEERVADTYQQLYIQLSDSLQAEEEARERFRAELQAQFELQQKEAELKAKERELIRQKLIEQEKSANPLRWIFN